MVEVVPHSAEWAVHFQALKARLLQFLQATALRVEHVGSTAVPGLSAKPIIDIDVVVADGDHAEARRKLALAGYETEGDLGIQGREAFRSPAGFPAHHLYVCAEGNRELERHLLFRDRLLGSPSLVRRYGRLKEDAARRFKEDRAAYTNAKSAFVEAVLEGRVAFPDR